MMKKIFTMCATVLVAMNVGAAVTEVMTCAEAAAAAALLDHNVPGTDSVAVIGYVTNTDGTISKGQQTFWMDDEKGSKKTFESYWGNLPADMVAASSPLNVGDKVQIAGFLTRYNSTCEMKNGTVTVLERATVKIDTIQATVCEAIEEGESLNDGDISAEIFEINDIVAVVENNNDTYHTQTFTLECVGDDTTKIIKPYNLSMQGDYCVPGDSVRILGKLKKYGDLVEVTGQGWVTKLVARTVITYTATSKLSETTSYSSSGLHTNAFNVSVSSHTFSNGTGTITFAGEVTTIGKYAFYQCSGLTSVTIPNSVTTIGDYAFQSCSGLTSVTIPNSVTTIGDYAFQSCSGLTSINVDASNTHYASVDGVLFNYAKDTLIQYPIGNARILYTIPNSVTTIGERAFYQCSGLTSVTIPNSVTTIGDYAFQSCSGLTSVTIPNSVTTIGDYAFQSCSGLTSVTIPNSVTTIGRAAFSGCSGLTSITIPNSVTTIKDYAFEDCSGLKTVIWNAKNCNGYNFGNQIETFIFGGSVEVIPASICNGMIKLTSVTIPNSVTTIGGEAFYKCSGLSDIYSYATIPPSCEAEEVFYGVSQHCYIHVPVGTVRAYELAFGWSHFLHFFEISEVPVGGTDQVGVEVTNNTAVFSWPVNPTASSYTLVIKKNDEVFCTLTFNSLGQLVGMAFAPARGANNDSSAQSTAYGYSFMVSNLDASSTYDYTFTAKDASNNVLTTTTGQFKTGGTATDILPLPYEGKDGIGSVKFIQNGRLLIERNGIRYNAHGAKVK